MNESPFQVVLRLNERGSGAWFAMVAVSPDYAAVLAELEQEVRAQLEVPLRILRAGNLSVSEVAREMTRDGNDWIAVVGLDDWAIDRWRTLDIDRNAWERNGPILLCLGPSAANALSANAPNIRSYIGSFHAVAPGDSGMSQGEVEHRLNELRTFYAFSDEAVIAMAKAGELPPGAHFVEWLILLDRGDLV